MSWQALFGAGVFFLGCAAWGLAAAAVAVWRLVTRRRAGRV